MQTKTFKTLSFTLSKDNVPSTNEEYDNAAKETNAACERALAHFFAHSFLTTGRAKICETVEELTGIKRKTKPKGEKTVFDETEQEYTDRVELEIGAAKYAALQPEVQAAVAALPLDFTAKVRGMGVGSKPAKKWLDWVIAMVKNSKIDSFCSAQNIEQVERSSEDELEEVTYGGLSDETVYAIASRVKTIITEKEQAAKKTAMAEINAM